MTVRCTLAVLAMFLIAGYAMKALEKHERKARLLLVEASR